MGSFVSQPLVVRFLKGVYESRPSVPRYVETWDVTVVLKFLATLHPPSKLTLRELTLKLVMLVSLVSGPVTGYPLHVTNRNFMYLCYHTEYETIQTRNQATRN